MKQKPEELAKEISNFVNRYNGDGEIEKLALHMASDHPTLQQNTMGLVLNFIKCMANKPYVDARNEASKETAIAALEGIRQMWVAKFLKSGMTQDGAEKQAKACIEQLSLPFI